MAMIYRGSRLAMAAAKAQQPSRTAMAAAKGTVAAEGGSRKYYEGGEAYWAFYACLRFTCNEEVPRRL
jgi:hypothetical protein